MRRLIALATVAVIAAVVVVVAATTGGGAHQPAAAAAMAGRPTGTTVALRRSPLGSILVDARGRTLYLFEADQPGMSACGGACAGIWPPYRDRDRTHRRGALRGQARHHRPARRRATGHHGGHPLYRYAGDAHPGATTGQGLNQFGGKWYVLNAAGVKIDND